MMMVKKNCVIGHDMVAVQRRSVEHYVDGLKNLVVKRT